MRIEWLQEEFSVCQLEEGAKADLSAPYCFYARTDREISLVCPTDCVPEHCRAREDGWKAMRFCGQLEFSLIGVLAGVAAILAKNEISLFAISTYDTDYVLLKKDLRAAAQSALQEAGYQFQ